jgi:hypothetical protein
MSRRLPEWRDKLPPEQKVLLEEIYRSLDAENLTLPMMGTRALVDMLMLEKVGDSGGFREKLKKFESAGYVSAKGREVLDVVLDLGSAAAHRGHASSGSEVQSVIDIVEDILRTVYVYPKVVEKLKDATPQRIRTKADVP